MCQNSICNHYLRSSKCGKCRMRKFAQANPLRYTYARLKSNAKRRGKDFRLTLRDWEEFCNQTNYLSLRGTTSESMTVDRIRDEIGYQLDNIQMLTLRQNRLKKKTRPRYIKQEGDPF